MFYEEPTSPDDIIGFRKIKDAHPDIKLALKDYCENKLQITSSCTEKECINEKNNDKEDHELLVAKLLMEKVRL